MEGSPNIYTRTHKELYQDVQVYAAAMRQMGIQKGDRVVGRWSLCEGKPRVFHFVQSCVPPTWYGPLIIMDGSHMNNDARFYLWTQKTQNSGLRNLFIQPLDYRFSTKHQSNNYNVQNWGLRDICKDKKIICWHRWGCEKKFFLKSLYKLIAVQK